MQHLNLYNQLEKKVEIILNARQQLWLMLAIAIIMLVIYIVLLVGKNSMEKSLQELDVRQRIVSDELKNLQIEKKRLEKNDVLDGEIKALQTDIAFRRQLLDSVDPNGAQTVSFSEHMAGLARQHINGMWFTKIQLLSGGQQLALAGKTRQPEFVPRYIQNLSQESVFNGHQFRVFRMNTNEEKTNILNFELRAHDVGPVE